LREEQIDVHFHKTKYGRLLDRPYFPVSFQLMSGDILVSPSKTIVLQAVFVWHESACSTKVVAETYRWNDMEIFNLLLVFEIFYF